DDHSLCVIGSVVVKQMIATVRKLSEGIHRALNNIGACMVKPVYRFPRLEVDVRILSRPSDNRMIRRQSSHSMLSDALFVDHCTTGACGQRLDLRYFMRGPKAVEKEQERDAGPQRRRVRY